MTDLVTDEAAEAVEAVLTDAGVDLYDNVHDLARLALTAAAPLIAAQATVAMKESRDWWKSTCEFWNESCTKAWQQRDSAIAASKQLETELADLRAGIEALRDEWRASEATVLIEDDGSHRTVYRAISYEKAATALAALLPERAR